MERSIQTGDVLLGRYRVEHILGRGGMGVVLAVRHVELGQLFAFKVLLPRALEGAGSIERFMREARAAATLRSEHAVKVIDVGRLEDGSPYMIMEHLTGSDLAALLRARGPLPVGEAADYVLQACEALAEAHAAGIVHRDLKPANLFLSRRPNGSACVKVLDFGISKHAGLDEIELTQTGAVLGSPQYMPPEQVRSSRTVDGRGDVWSMGVVLYKLVTGVLPFRGELAHEVIASVLEDDVAPPTTVVPGLPPSLDMVVARTLQKKPERRFQRIEDFAAAVRAVAGGAVSAEALFTQVGGTVAPSAEPLVPTLSGASVDAARTLRRRNYRLALALGTALIAAVLMAVAGFLLGARTAAPAAATGEGTAAPLAMAGPSPGDSNTQSVQSAPAVSVVPEPTGAAAEPSAPTSRPSAGAHAAPAKAGRWAAPAATPSAAPTAAASAKPRTIF